MWPWIKRWRDWAMHDLWPLYRLRPQPRVLHYGYEKAGLTLLDQPIPWNAEAVVVEALLRLPSPGLRRKGDYQLRVPGFDPYPAEVLHRHDGEQEYRLSFRIPPPPMTVSAEILYHGRLLAQLTLPHLSREDFLQNLRFQMPTLFVRLGNDSVACRTFVSTQCKGLTASALLYSPTSLAPILDLDLQVEFRCERGGKTSHVPARLSSSQLAANQALIMAVPRRFPRRIGDCVATWIAGDRALASQRVRAISQRHFQRSLRIADTRFVTQNAKGVVRLSRQLSQTDHPARVGPCFLVCSCEPGMAGFVPLRVQAQVAGAIQPPVLLEQEVLITDGPTMVAPGTLDAADLAQINAFELCLKERSLGALSLCPTPTASFTSEGGFKGAAPEFTWTAASEEELNERLNRLFEGRGPGE
jgi:hypothetical protein